MRGWSYTEAVTVGDARKCMTTGTIEREAGMMGRETGTIEREADNALCCVQCVAPDTT